MNVNLLEFERLHYSVQRKLQQLLFKHGQKEPADHIHATTETMSAETYHICSETKLVSYICAHRDDLADRNQRLIAFLDHWLNGQSLYHALSGKPVQHLNKHISEIRMARHCLSGTSSSCLDSHWICLSIPWMRC